MAEKKEILELAGHEVAVSNPSKIYFPQAGVTKLEMVRYYLAVAPGALGGVRDRPMALKRFVNGAEAEPFQNTLLSLRLGAYGENRDSGLVNAASSADGVTASLTLAHPQSAGDLGWRVQAWLRNTGFSNISASVAPGRTAGPGPVPG